MMHTLLVSECSVEIHHLSDMFSVSELEYLVSFPKKDFVFSLSKRQLEDLLVEGKWTPFAPSVVHGGPACCLIRVRCTVNRVTK
jgi:hypothetical protein